MINHIGDADPLAARGLFPLKDDLNHEKAKREHPHWSTTQENQKNYPLFYVLFIFLMSEYTHDYCQ
ncbi:hypothetical protein [Paenibacillus illinoisensis]|uniref:hypothetical protein n=1 Tax=Paenibacillus illinoisensis TaxID=59845 RepID=UPI00203BEB67|nr:hypothetical protein [Paenibacillus illinoisensis]